MIKLGIIGLGNMGEAVVRSLIKSIGADSIIGYEVKENKAISIKSKYGITLATNIEDLVNLSSYIVIAVKPQDAKYVLSKIGSTIDGSKVIISIMAGITIANILEMLGNPANIVRVMPNICISIAEGALGVTANSSLSADDRQKIMELLSPLGSIAEVTEDQMNAVTALSGSGPAFVLTFLDALIDGGVRMGLPRDKARILAVQTMKGTINMLEKENLHPVVMKETITSPGGTTIAGLVILEERGFKGTVIRSLEAAQARAEELSK
jgi:pyrroline-5-carboxylate reductase